MKRFSLLFTAFLMAAAVMQAQIKQSEPIISGVVFDDNVR